jgi:hypothetical protein
MPDPPEVRLLREEIESTRIELARTVEALAGRMDVKSRASRSLAASPLRSALLASALTGLLALVVKRILARRAARRDATHGADGRRSHQFSAGAQSDHRHGASTGRRCARGQ